MGDGTPKVIKRLSQTFESCLVPENVLGSSCWMSGNGTYPAQNQRDLGGYFLTKLLLRMHGFYPSREHQKNLMASKINFRTRETD